MDRIYKTPGVLIIKIIAVFLIGCAPMPAHRAAPPPQAEAAGQFHTLVDVAFVRPYIRMPRPRGVAIIDSRPYLSGFIAGHIPTAVSIPAAQFDQFTHRLPADKNSLLIFYCDNTTCRQSHASARKAEQLGYHNVKVLAGGYSAYIRSPGAYAGISAPYLIQLLSSGRLMLVDARPRRAKYDKGYIPTAISMPVTEFDQLKGKLPADRTFPLVFYCCGLT